MKTMIKNLFVLALVCFVFTGCATSHSSKPKQWEYKSVYLGGTDHDQSKLNEFGKDGWQLVSVVPSSIDDSSYGDKRRQDLNTAIYFFKRPKQ